MRHPPAWFSDRGQVQLCSGLLRHRPTLNACEPVGGSWQRLLMLAERGLALEDSPSEKLGWFEKPVSLGLVCLSLCRRFVFVVLHAVPLPPPHPSHVA